MTSSLAEIFQGGFPQESEFCIQRCNYVNRPNCHIYQTAAINKIASNDTLIFHKNGPSKKPYPLKILITLNSERSISLELDMEFRR